MKAILFILILKILILTLDARVPLATDECQALINLKTDPETCCTLPQPAYNFVNEERCREECLEKKRKRCCIRKCRVERIGIFVNETFNKDALKKFLLNGEEIEKIWGDKVEAAVEKCSEKCEKFIF